MTAVEQVRGWFAQHRHEQARASVIARSLGAELDAVVGAMDELLRGGELIGARVTRGDGTRDIDARLALSRSGPPSAPAFNGPVAPGRLIVPRPTTAAPLAPGAYTVSIPAATAVPPPSESVPERVALTAKRLQMLGRVQASTGQTTGQLAALQGVSEGGAYYLLRELKQVGLVMSFNPTGGRCKELWTLTDAGLRQLRALEIDERPPAAELQAAAAELQAAAATSPAEAPRPTSPAAPGPTLNVDDAVRSLNEAMRQLEDGAHEVAERQRRTAHVQALASTPLTAVLGCNGSLQLRRGEATFDVLPTDVADLYRIACAARVLTEGL